MRSFRWKIVLLSTLLSGVVLCVMALFTLAAVRRIGLERLDCELQALGDVHLRLQFPAQHWSRVYEAMVALYGDQQQGLHVLRANDGSGKELFTSPNWPASVSNSALNLPGGAGPSQPATPPEAQVPPGPLVFVPGPGLLAPPLAPPPAWLTDPSSALHVLPAWRHSPDRPPPDFHPPIQHPVAPRFLTLAAAGRDWRFAIMGNEGVTLIIGADLTAFHAEVRRVGAAVAVVAPMALLLLAGAGWLLAGQALRPVRMIAQVASEISARELDRRVPDVVADREFQHLVEVINTMLARIERSFRQATRFGADAAHELKTPLTILQGQLEQAVQEAAHDSREQRRQVELLEEVQRLKQIVRKLLLLAQADAGQLALHRKRLDFSSLAQAAVDDLHALAPHLQVTAEITPGIMVSGDTDLVNQAVQNLTLNAAKFNDERALVHIRLRPSGGAAVFSIANTGAGIPPAEQDRLFERFYRADKSRNRRVDGTGLGLSLAREITRAHGGDLVLERAATQMTTFVLALPLSFQENAGHQGATPGAAAMHPSVQ